MRKVAVDDLPTNPHADADRRDLTDPLDAAGVALNRFSLEPGEWASGLHAHDDQEEVYVVIAGELTVERLDGTTTLEADEAARFAPEEHHAARNEGDADAELLALGAPRDSEVVRIPLDCLDCDARGLRPAMDDEGPALVCPDCGAERDATCPECGSPEMMATVPGGREDPVGVCRACGAVDDRP